MYFEAWRREITGITCYRDGSRGLQPLKKCDDNGACDFHNENASKEVDPVGDFPADYKG